MKLTLVVIGTCYSGVSLLAHQQCLIAQEPVSKQLYVLSTGSMHTPHPVELHELVGAYSSVVINTANHEVKTHD